jgi:hypothetical protein
MRNYPPKGTENAICTSPRLCRSACGKKRITTIEFARKFLRDLDASDKDYFCCYGHGGCSTYHHGPCMDETLSNFPELVDEDRGSS